MPTASISSSNLTGPVCPSTFNFLIPFVDQLCKCCRFLFLSIEFHSPAHLLILLLCYGRVVWLASCAARKRIFCSVCFRLFRHILHMRCWRLRGSVAEKLCVWVDEEADWLLRMFRLLLLFVSFSPCAGQNPHLHLCSTFFLYPSILARFFIKHFS